MSAVDAFGRAPAAERLAQGEAERDAGIEVVENAADQRLVLAINAAIENAIDSGERFSVNDIRDQFPVVAENLVGARFRGYCRKRIDGKPIVIPVDRTFTTSPGGHAREIKVWQNATAAAQAQAISA